MSCQLLTRNVRTIGVLAEMFLSTSSPARLCSTVVIETDKNILKDLSDGTKSGSRAMTRRDYRFIFPEFLPDPDRSRRNLIREKMERKDMLRRRNQVELPEFYVGSIIAVTTADPNATTPGKTSRFNGIVIDRGGTGLRAWCIVRNCIDGQGIELLYQLYSPVITKLEVLRLEKRLDEELLYLRDAPLEFSTFPMDMEAEILPEGTPVPVNPIIVPLKERPWHKRWERFTDRLKGFSLKYGPGYVSDGKIKAMQDWKSYMNQGWQMEVNKYDLMRNYHHSIPVEEQDAIWEEVGDALEERDKTMRKVAAKRAFSKPSKRG